MSKAKCVHHESGGCGYLFNCCDCGDSSNGGCGCIYCFSCNACEVCTSEESS